MSDMNYHDKMREAFDMMQLTEDGNDAEEIIFKKILRAAPVFKEIRDYCVEVPLFAESEEKFIEFKEAIGKDGDSLEKRIYHVFHYFCDRVGKAPTSAHVNGCVILIIPLLSDYIEEYLQTIK